MASTLNASTTLGLISSADTSGVLQLQTANTAAVTINASQNVGIGTASPVFKLDVNTSANSQQWFALRNLNSGSSSSMGLLLGNDSNAAYGSIFCGSTTYSSFGGASSINLGTYSTTPIVFFTNNSEKMRLDSSGNLGLGVTPTSIQSGYKAIQIGATVGGGIVSAGTDTYFTNNAYVTGGSWYFGSTGYASYYNQGGGVHIWSTSTASGSGGGVATMTERMRLDASGALIIGATAFTPQTGKFKVVHDTGNQNIATSINSAASSPYGDVISFTGASPNNGTNYFLLCADTTATRAQFYSNGGLANYSANNVNLSDRREKTNFAPATSYLDKICAIPVQTFNYLDQNLEQDDGLTLGVVAQDVQAIAPELVTETNWGTVEEPKMRLSIYQTDLQYALMKCIQEQQAIIETLKADVAALKGTV